jgi:hypothetical protein
MQEEAEEVGAQNKVTVEYSPIHAVKAWTGHVEEVEHFREQLEMIQIDDYWK